MQTGVELNHVPGQGSRAHHTHKQTGEEETQGKTGKTEKHREKNWIPSQSPDSTSPLTGASRHPTRLVRMSLIKVPQKRGIQNEATRNPRMFLLTITLPVHQILEPTAPVEVQNPPCSVGRMIANEPGGRGGSAGGHKGLEDTSLSNET